MPWLQSEAPRADVERVRLRPGDRRVLTLARRKLGGGRVDFADALRALREAVEEAIPSGRIYLLGASANGPIFGSVISGVGITEGEGRVMLVRVDREGRPFLLGPWRR